MDAKDCRLALTEYRANSAPSFNLFSLNGSTVRVGMVFEMPYTDTINAFGFLYGVRTGTPATYIGAIESLTSGLPSGVTLGSPACNATFTPPASTAWDNLWQWITFPNPLSMVRGTSYALTIKYSSGTINGSNFSSYNQDAASYGNYRRGGNYVVNGTGSWARSVQGPPMFGLQSATRSYGFPFVSGQARAVSTTGNRGAAKFTIPAWWTSANLRGFWMQLDSPLGSGQWKPGVWDAAGNVIQADLKSTDNQGQLNLGSAGFDLSFSAPALCVGGTPYYAGIECVNSVSFSPNVLVLPTAADQSAYPLGTNCNYSLWNGSAWVDTLTDRPLVELMFSDINSAFVPGGTNVRSIGTY